jgi:hypothetical protein
MRLQNILSAHTCFIGLHQNIIMKDQENRLDTNPVQWNKHLPHGKGLPCTPQKTATRRSFPESWWIYGVTITAN